MQSNNNNNNQNRDISDMALSDDNNNDKTTVDQQRQQQPQLQFQSMDDISGRSSLKKNEDDDDDDGSPLKETCSHTTTQRDFVIQPNRYSSRIKKRQQRIHAFKVGLGVLIALQFVLIGPIDTFFQHTGAWAVITVAVVILQTPGETTKKMLNRTMGTAIAAALAIGIGLAAHELSQVAYPTGHVLVAVVNFIAAVGGITLADRGGTWSYAYLLGTITFVFLSSSILVEEDVWVGVFRAVMIAVGGMIGLMVAWIPPTVSTTAMTKAYMADALVDTSLAAQVLVDNLLEGRQLHPIHLIKDADQDDDFHKLSKAVQVSRIPLEASLQASAFEGTPKTEISSMRTSGLAVRLTLRSLLAADMLLRQQYITLDSSTEVQAKLGLALKGVVASIRDTMLHHQLIVNDAEDVDDENGDEDELNSAVPLSQSLMSLQVCLADYVAATQQQQQQEQQQQQHDNDDIDFTTTIHRFACHVGFARNVFDAGNHFQAILPHLIATNTADLGSTTHHGSSVLDAFL